MSTDDDSVLRGTASAPEEAIEKLKTKVRSWMFRCGIDRIAHFRGLKEDIESALRESDPDVISRLPH